MLTIDQLVPDDWARLRRLRLAALADAPAAFGSTLADAQSYGETDWRQQLEELTTFVAGAAAGDLGMVRGTPDEDVPSDALLISMWVAPAARGQGVGELLVEAVVQWASAAGFARLKLDVTEGNVAAIALYQRLGFRATGETGAMPPPRAHIREHRLARPLQGTEPG